MRTGPMLALAGAMLCVAAQKGPDRVVFVEKFAEAEAAAKGDKKLMLIYFGSKN